MATCRPGGAAPTLVHPPAGLPTWTRQAVLDYMQQQARTIGPVLAGFDMSVAFPFCDIGTYFPGHPGSPPHPRALWRAVDALSENAPDFYAGAFSRPGQSFADYLNAPHHRGCRYDIRRLRVTDQQCLTWTRPASVFNGVGPGSVGTGSLNGMRFFHALRQVRDPDVAIWPFDRLRGNERLVACEIFPRLYVKQAGLDPRRWREPGFLNEVLAAYRSRPLTRCTWSEDEIDALYSAAAMRVLAGRPATWAPPAMTAMAARQEGWILGL